LSFSYLVKPDHICRKQSTFVQWTGCCGLSPLSECVYIVTYIQNLCTKHFYKKSKKDKEISTYVVYKIYCGTFFSLKKRLFVIPKSFNE
jgi:hypothetical protein